MADVDERTPAGGTTELKTILFADVVESTRLYDERGDDVAHRLLVQCLDLMTKVVEDGSGVVEERIGDELLCTFDDADTAAQAASELQQRVEGDTTAASSTARCGFASAWSTGRSSARARACLALRYTEPRLGLPSQGRPDPHHQADARSTWPDPPPHGALL